jgi:hypothetical protein
MNFWKMLVLCKKNCKITLLAANNAFFNWFSWLSTFFKGNLVITYNIDATTRILRNKDDFRLPTYKKTYTQNSMWYDGLKLFNELTPAMKEHRNLERFKETIFNWLKQRFPVVWIKSFVYYQIYVNKIISLWDTLINYYIIIIIIFLIFIAFWEFL